VLREVEIDAILPERWADVLPEESAEAVVELAARGREALEGVTIWNVNSTAKGGGVAEMLGPLVSEARGAGVDARWLVIEGDEPFFRVTKRIHNRLHGQPGDGGPLGDEERAAYESVARRNAEELCPQVRECDVVILHDPQTAGLAEAVAARGAAVVWRCHVGVDEPNAHAREAWSFIAPYLEHVGAYVFSRRNFAWETLDSGRVSIIHPSIDVFAAKNRPLAQGGADAILARCGLLAEGSGAKARFLRDDGSEGDVEREMSIVQDAAIPPGAPIVTQVSRWDGLKDPLGVIRGFAEGVAPRSEAHLVLAGPDVEAVKDDPEGREMLECCKRAREELPAEVRARVHLAALPMDDREENAAMVNALQAGSDVVVQKSLAEGFGLTVSEAMWKGRPVIGSRVGGIQDQIADGETGRLVDPCDLEGFAVAVRALLDDPEGAQRCGDNARARVEERFLGPHHLEQYLKLFEALRGRARM
jgi:trehalose synthase